MFIQRYLNFVQHVYKKVITSIMVQNNFAKTLTIRIINIIDVWF